MESCLHTPFINNLQIFQWLPYGSAFYVCMGMTWYVVWYGGYITHRFSWLSQIIREKEIWISSVLNENFNVKCQSQSTPDTAMHSCLIQSTLSMLKLLLCMCAYIYLSITFYTYRLHCWCRLISFPSLSIIKMFVCLHSYWKWDILSK